MQINRTALFLALAGCISIFSSCTRHEGFEVSDFKPLSNWQTTQQGYKTIYLDYKGAIKNGFVIPSVRQTTSGYFVFQFSIRSYLENSQQFHYKIYYQDESYKFPEIITKEKNIKEDSLAEENFYGSWEEQPVGFKQTNLIPNDGSTTIIQDSFRIVGNPRNEQKYFSTDTLNVSEDSIRNLENYIRSNPKWMERIKVKAKQEHRPEELQLHLDAMWTLKSRAKTATVNNRWQRNPRVGKYSFMLVITTENNIWGEQIPKYIQNISQQDSGRFINPYYYFLYRKNDSIADIKVLTSGDTLKVIANPDLGNGIYIKNDSSRSFPRNTSCFTANCGNAANIESEAAFRQYFNSVDPNLKLNNIPVVADVTGNEYTVEDYRKNIFPDSKLVHVPMSITDCPCKTVVSDPVKHSIKLTNPASTEGQLKKEDVGIMSRDGFTYGKYYFKVKLPSLLNKSKLWNGLTDAMWLIYQADLPWNYRRFAKNGYIPKYVNNASYQRKQQLAYSEIDFEILKAAHYWPETSYHQDTKHIPVETPADSDKIMVAYTNWDMACKDVPHYTVGADSIYYKGKYYGIHRWDDYYKALTGKDPEKNDELFNQPYYYFEIEWKPREIIWRIGPEKDKMRVIGYVNDSVSAIPNNQMVIVISQEFHFSKWWPNLPFLQERIPFPSKDITGEIYKIEIE